MNEQLAYQVIHEVLKHGVQEFCVCPGSRNSPLVTILTKETLLKKYYWFEERSAAFFALGRSRQTRRPVAVITTSGTAAAELLPAVMEAHYTGVPLVVITADRPRRFRNTGAPQTAEQVGLYGPYTSFAEDLSEAERSYLELWDRHGPAHVNVCFEEPLKVVGKLPPENAFPTVVSKEKPIRDEDFQMLTDFLKSVQFPFVVVSSLREEDREPVAQFLLKMNAPVLLEGISGLREDPRLSHLRIRRVDKLWDHSTAALYEIDGILRIGGVPTFRNWRDLEDMQYKLQVLSVNHVPFSGLSWGKLICSPIHTFFEKFTIPPIQKFAMPRWLEAEKEYQKQFLKLVHDEPLAEQSMVHHLSKIIPRGSHVYLGNSLPIREWDLGAVWEPKGLTVTANRGVNGIDGQISTFLGLSREGIENWALLGDLTALYDMAGPWILKQLKHLHVHIVVINNRGGKIFEKMYQEKEFLNLHSLNFKPLADMWGLEYERWTTVECKKSSAKRRLIELIPDEEATRRFSDKLGTI